MDKKQVQKPKAKEKETKKLSSSVSRPQIRKAAEAYMKLLGKPMTHPTMTYDVSPERGARIAEAYEKMQHNPNDPAVKKAYDALIKETKNQWDFIKNNTGLEVSKITPDMPNPYPNGSKDVMKDIEENNHLWYFPTEQGYGSDNKEVKDHPLLEKIDVDGEEMPANDLFRIVHDYFGHAKEGFGFGPQGEENAWLTHKQMYSPEAQKALTSETRGQNSWVNFGPQGEENRKNPEKTTYAEQKAGLLPDWVMNEVPTTGREKLADGGEVYHGEHEAPDPSNGAAIFRVTEGGIYPEDIHGINGARYYGHGTDPLMDNEAVRIIKAARGKPNLFFSVYRAVPKDVKGSINKGDWVTTVRKYAKEHGESALNNNYKIIKKLVNARDIFTDGNSIFEYGYHPHEPVPNQHKVAATSGEYPLVPKKLAEGGEIEERPGEHLVHYSHHEEPLEVLDPTKHGTGRAGLERRRGKVIPRTYYYEAGSEPESLIADTAKHRYVVQRPEKIMDLASEEAGPYLQQVRDMNELEELLKASGYAGYKNSAHPQIANAVALFHSHKPVHHKAIKRYAGGGDVAGETYDTNYNDVNRPTTAETPAPTPAPETQGERYEEPPMETGIQNNVPQENPLKFTKEYAPVYDITGSQAKLIHTDHASVQKGILNGTYSFDKNQEVPVFNPEGKLGVISGDRAAEMLRRGYVYATPEAVNIHRHGDLAQQTLGTLESVGQGLFGVAAPMLETATGLTTKEDILARRQANPNWHSGVETAAFALPLLATFGEWGAAKAGLTGVAEGLGALNKATQYTAPGLISKLGTKVVPIAETATFFPTVGLGAIRGAFESALATGTHEVTQKFLDNPDVSADNVISALGMSALYGGILGAAVPAAFSVFPKLKAIPAKFRKMTGKGGEEPIIEGAPSEEVEEGLTPAEQAQKDRIAKRKADVERMEQAHEEEEEIQEPLPMEVGTHEKEPRIEIERPEPVAPVQKQEELFEPSPETPIEASTRPSVSPDTPHNVNPTDHPEEFVEVSPEQKRLLEQSDPEARIQNDPNLTDEQKQEYLNKSKNLKKDIKKILEVWRKVVKTRYPDAGLPIGLTRVEEALANLEQAQAKSGLFGGTVNRDINYVYEGIKQELTDSIGRFTKQEGDILETGEHISALINEDLDALEKYFDLEYKAIKKVYNEIPLNDNIKQSMIKSADDLYKSLKIDHPGIKSQLKSFKNTVNLKENLDDLKQLKTQLNNNTKTGSVDSNVKSFIWGLQDIVHEHEFSTLENMFNVMTKEADAIRAVNPQRAAQLDKNAVKYLQAKAARETVNAEFAQETEKYKELFERMGIKGARTFKDYGRLFEEQTPEKIVKAFDKKNNYSNQKWLKENFPLQFRAFRNYKISKLLEKNKVSAQNFDLSKFFNTIVNDLPAKERALYFSPEQIQSIMDANYLFRSMPKNFNPSGSGDRIAMHHLLQQFANPLTWGTLLAKETAMTAGVKAFKYSEAEIEKILKNSSKKFAEGGEVTSDIPNFPSSSVPSGLSPLTKYNGPMDFKDLVTAHPQIQASVRMAQAVIKGDKIVKDSIKSVFDPKSTYKIPAPTEKSLNTLKEYVSQAQKNPNSLLQAADNVHPAVPEFASPFSQAITRAASYLQTMQPKPMKQGPMDMNVPAPKTPHDDIYNHVAKIVEQPMYIMHKIKSGTLIPEEVNAFKTVYPSLYTNVCQDIVGHLAETKHTNGVIPYRVKIGLSMFMGQPLDSTMTPQGITAAQSTSKGSQQAQGGPGAQGQGGGKHTLSPLAKMANMSKTPLQNREEESSTKQ